MSEARTTSELVKLLQDQNTELFEMLKGLDESQMELSGVQGFRSIKDILAHITYWNKQGIMWLESVYDAIKPVMPVSGDTQDDIKEGLAVINAEVHERNRERPVREVIEEYKETFADVIYHVRKLETRHLDMVFDYPWASGPVTGRSVVMWRFWHQQNHTKHIKTWLENQETG